MWFSSESPAESSRFFQGNFQDIIGKIPEKKTERIVIANATEIIYEHYVAIPDKLLRGSLKDSLTFEEILKVMDALLR